MVRIYLPNFYLTSYLERNVYIGHSHAIFKNNLKKGVISISRKKIRIKHKGSLKRYGFKLSGSKKTQMKAIRKADRHYSKAEVDRKLAALEAFNKHHPEKRKRVKALIKSNQES